MTDPDYWFVRKSFGFGAIPVTWQGVAVIVGYGALLLGDLHLLQPAWARWVVAGVLTIGLLGITAHKTKGGLGWRWGGPSDDR